MSSKTVSTLILAYAPQPGGCVSVPSPAPPFSARLLAAEGGLRVGKVQSRLVKPSLKNR